MSIKFSKNMHIMKTNFNKLAVQSNYSQYIIIYYHNFILYISVIVAPYGYIVHGALLVTIILNIYKHFVYNPWSCDDPTAGPCTL